MKAIVIAASLLLAACSGGSGDPEAPGTQEAEAAQDRETAFDPLTRQLDEAKAVEDTVMQHKKDVDAAIDDDDPL